jgi:tRNA(Ile)-lysidine synthase
MAKKRDRRFQKVSEFIRRQMMLDDARGVVVAVSGGADSVTLLDILVRLRDLLNEQPQGRELPLRVAHLNHLLRGQESDADEEFVCRLAKRLAVELTTESADVYAIARATGKGIEDCARELRYRFFARVADEHGCNRIATGHTMNDQAETFVMRLARGAGLRGLAAMRAVIPAHQFDQREAGFSRPETDKARNGHTESSASPLPLGESVSPLLIRPLLCVTRDEVEAYCLERRLEFRRDASNESLRYTRNRVRHETMKALGSLNPKVVERIAQTAELLAGEEQALEEAAQRFLEQAEQVTKSWPGDGLVLRQAYSIAALLEHSAGLRRRMLLEAVRRVRPKGRPIKARRSEITSAHIEATEKLLQEGSSGQRIHLPDGVEVWREFEALVFVCGLRQQGETSGSGEAFALEAASRASAIPGEYAYSISNLHPVVEVAGLRISLRRKQPGAVLAELLEEARTEKALSGRDWKIVALDEALVPENLLVRPRKKGEMVQVSGRSKIIKLKKLMIDHKIAPSRRTSWPIVVTLDGEYVWSPGLPPALKFAARDKTPSLAILRASDV